MDDQLAILEAKVLEAIEIIHGLRQENGDLKGRCQELEGRSGELELQNEQLQKQLEEARENAAQTEFYEERRRLVEEKVGGLLSKLEAIG